MTMTRDEILKAPADDYMNEAQMAFFRKLLENLRTETTESIEAAKQQLASPPEMNDEADRAAYEEESRLRSSEYQTVITATAGNPGSPSGFPGYWHARQQNCAQRLKP